MWTVIELMMMMIYLKTYLKTKTKYFLFNVCFQCLFVFVYFLGFPVKGKKYKIKSCDFF